jgi:DNA-binding NarL/FixJ family response regulator
VDVSAYRIVQEALTNALKRAGPARAHVILRYRSNTLDIEVLDDGTGDGNGGGSGHGLAGMRRTCGDLRRRARVGSAAGGRLRAAGAVATRRDAVIRVLLADDQSLVRAGFRMILKAEPDMDVVGEAGDGREAVERVGALAPDVVLMDIRMPGVDGIEATRQITARGGAPRVLVLTTFDLDEYVYESLRAGASAFLLKDAPPEHQLVAAIRVVADGGSLFAPSVTRRLISKFAGDTAGAARRPELDGLTAAAARSAPPRRARPFMHEPTLRRGGRGTPAAPSLRPES